MATEAQILANRENAKKSCGPVTETGKRNSSKNATVHGIFVSIPAMDEEEAEQLTALYKTLCRDYDAGSNTECLIIWSMSVAHFRLQRAQNAEHALYLLDRHENESEEQPWSHAAAYLRLMASGDLARMTRYQRGFERTWEKNLAELRRLQADRQKREFRAAEAAREQAREASYDADAAFFETQNLAKQFSKEELAAMEAELTEFKKTHHLRR